MSYNHIYFIRVDEPCQKMLPCLYKSQFTMSLPRIIHKNRLPHIHVNILRYFLMLVDLYIGGAGFKGERPRRYPKGLHKTEIESTDLIETFIPLKSRKFGLYFLL
jgi:hypothetical protein